MSMVKGGIGRSGAIMAVALLGAAMAALPRSGLAQDDTWLSDAQIESHLKGRTLDGMYASGRRFTESYLEGGALQYSEDGLTLTGRWSVRSGTLCTIYDTDPTGGCFRVTAPSHNCLEFYFVTRTEATAPGSPDTKPDWTARGAVEGKAEACAESADV